MTNGDNGGRDDQGRFTRGNPGGPGNPYTQQVATFRRALVEAITEVDIIAIVQTLVTKAKGGDIAAARVLFDRLLGKPLAADILERIEALEGHMEDHK